MSIVIIKVANLVTVCYMVGLVEPLSSMQWEMRINFPSLKYFLTILRIKVLECVLSCVCVFCVVEGWLCSQIVTGHSISCHILQNLSFVGIIQTIGCKILLEWKKRSHYQVWKIRKQMLYLVSHCHLTALHSSLSSTLYFFPLQFGIVNGTDGKATLPRRDLSLFVNSRPQSNTPHEQRMPLPP